MFAGEVIPGEEIWPGGATATFEHWSTEDPWHCETSGRTPEVSLCETYWTGGEKQCCQLQTQTDGKCPLYLGLLFTKLKEKFVSVKGTKMQFQRHIFSTVFRVFKNLPPNSNIQKF